MNIKIKLFIGILLIILLTSCDTKPSATLSDNSCEAPCWRNISMGMSRDEVYSKLQGMKDIQINSIQTGPTYKPYWQDEITWSFENEREEKGGIYFHDGKAVMMIFSLADDLPFSAMIEKYGEPQQVWSTKAVLDGVMLEIGFMYPQKGICFEHKPNLYLQNPDNYQVKQDTKIQTITFFDPAIASYGQINVGCIWSIDIGKIQSWKGYGEYRIFSH